MRLGAKHRNVAVISYVDFTGGVNFTKPPEALAPNECASLINFEFDPTSGVLKQRDGLEKILNFADINSIYEFQGKLLITAAGKLYSYDEIDGLVELGDLTGNLDPVYAHWADSFLIASGGKLQKYDGTQLTTIINSPDAISVVVQYGRVVVVSGDDYVYFSGVGDETNWNFTGTDADALQLEIGYKDGGDVVALGILSKDLVVFKSNRRIYRIVGGYPDWFVYNVSTDAGLINLRAFVELARNIVFVDSVGVRSLDTVVEYGDLKVYDVGSKVNAYIVSNMKPDLVRVWHLPSKGQLWVKMQDDEFVYVYHYNQNAWTSFSFPFEVKAVYGTSQQVYVALEDGLYSLSANANDNGRDIQSIAILARRTPGYNYLVKRIIAILSSTAEVSLNISVGKFSRNYTVSPTGQKVYEDDDILYNDTDPVAFFAEVKIAHQCNFRVDGLQPTIVLRGYGARLVAINFVVSEV